MATTGTGISWNEFKWLYLQLLLRHTWSWSAVAAGNVYFDQTNYYYTYAPGPWAMPVAGSRAMRNFRVIEEMLARIYPYDVTDGTVYPVLVYTNDITPINASTDYMAVASGIFANIYSWFSQKANNVYVQLVTASTFQSLAKRWETNLGYMQNNIDICGQLPQSTINAASVTCCVTPTGGIVGFSSAYKMEPEIAAILETTILPYCIIPSTAYSDGTSRELWQIHYDEPYFQITNMDLSDSTDGIDQYAFVKMKIAAALHITAGKGDNLSETGKIIENVVNKGMERIQNKVTDDRGKQIAKAFGEAMVAVVTENLADMAMRAII
jgi:hypothetical protein